MDPLALMTGIDVPILENSIVLHQPTVKEISYIGEKNFFIGVQCLCIKKEMCIEDESLLLNTNNFQIFMTVMEDKNVIDKKNNVIDVLSLLFPNYKVIFTPRSLLLNGEGQICTIDETNFEQFQQILSLVFCLKNDEQEKFNPGNDLAKKIADKLKKARTKVAQVKALENEGVSLLSQYVSTLAVGLNSMSLKECLDLTLYQLYDLMERYSLYINWDIDLRSRLAGGKPDKPAENWMKNIH